MGISSDGRGGGGLSRCPPNHDPNRNTDQDINHHRNRSAEKKQPLVGRVGLAPCLP